MDGGEPEQTKGVVVNAIRTTPEETEEERLDPDELESMTKNALAILDAGKSKACEQAVAALPAGIRKHWDRLLSRDLKDCDEDREPATPDPDGLRRFIKTTLEPLCVLSQRKLTNRPFIRAQAFGQSLDLNKLERTLTMLLRLQNLRLFRQTGAEDGWRVSPVSGTLVPPRGRIVAAPAPRCYLRREDGGSGR